MVRIMGLNLEDRVYRGLPSGWSDLAKFTGYPVLAASAVVGSANCNGKSPSPTNPTPIDPAPSAFTVTSQVPNGVLPEGTTQTIFGVNTSKEGMCRYDEGNVPYASMTRTLDSAPAMQHITTLTGLSPGSIDYFVACVTPDNSQSINGHKITVQVASPQQGSGVEFTNSIKDIIDGSVPGNGTITIDGKLGPRITNGNYTVTRDMNLAVGSKPYLVISAPGYQTREGTFTVTPRGFEAGLGGGRTEFPLTLYHDIPGTFTAAEYAAFCLRDGALQRIEEPLTFAIFDTKLYQWQAGKGVEKGDFNMRPLTKSELLNFLRNYLTSNTNGIYNPGNIENFIHLQSRGDSLPDLSKGIHQPGWIIICQDYNNNAPLGWTIDRGDNGYENGGRITAGGMIIRTDHDIYGTQWGSDILQTMGPNELPGGNGPNEPDIFDRIPPYLRTLFSRPVGQTLPDKSR